MNLRLMAKGVLGIMFLLTGGWLSQGLTKSLPTVLAQAPLNSTGATIIAQPGEKFPQLVRRGEQTARSLLEPLFAAGAQEGYIQIGVKSRSSIFPLMDVRVSRADWSQKPSSLLPYSRVFTETESLIEFSPTPKADIIKRPAKSPSTTSATTSSENKKTAEGQQATPENKKVDSSTSSTGSIAEPSSNQLSSSAPKADSKRVPVNTPIMLSFKDLLAKDVKSLGVQIMPAPKGGNESLSDKTYQFTPQPRLGYSTEYTVTVSGSKEKPLKEPIKLKFTTEPQYTYKKDIQTMLAGTCTSCHSTTGTQRNRSELDTYAKVLKYVTPGIGGELINPKWLALHASGGGTGGPGFLPKAGLRQRGDKVIGGGGATSANPFGTVAPSSTTSATGTASTADSLQGNAGSSLSTDTSNVSRGNRQGALTDEQVTILKTWIVQDKAVEE
ncbi:MAG: Ig-like domain-containing protein [Gloeobacterales cyanobacterium]